MSDGENARMHVPIEIDAIDLTIPTPNLNKCTQRKRVLKRQFYCDPVASTSKPVSVTGFRYNLRVKPTRRLAAGA